MRVHPFVDEGLGHSSYLVDLGDGTAAIVDPPRFPEAEERLAADLGLHVGWTLDTHSHADYVTGSPGLARRGYTVDVLDGGPDTWSTATGRPLDPGR